MEAERCGLHLRLICQERAGGMFGKGGKKFFLVFPDKSEHTRFVSTRRHGSRNRPFGDFQCVTGSTGTGAEVDGS